MRKFIAAVVFFVAYCAVAWIPGESLWFNPQAPIFGDVVEGEVPPLAYTRHIKRETSISYTVVVRNVETNEIVCEARSGPFDYKPIRGPLVGKDLVWWAPSDPRCGFLRPGTYWADTTWIIQRPFGDLLPGWIAPAFGWLIPPKEVTRDSPPFTVTLAEGEGT